MDHRTGLIHSLFVAVYSAAAALTMIPVPMASKACLLGYRALCRFTPMSTAILLAGGSLHFYLATKR
jgi:hypothetical protein